MTMAIAGDQMMVFLSKGCQKTSIVIMKGIYHLPTQLCLAVASGLTHQLTVGLISLPVSPLVTVSCYPCGSSGGLVQLYLCPIKFFVGRFFYEVLIRLVPVGLIMSSIFLFVVVLIM